ncbi:MAG: tetratricopeptide repeat protein [Spirochaetota bacterium]
MPDDRALYASLAPYIAEDRRRALAMGCELPFETHGSALFADLSGFTSLTEMLRLRHGRRKGGEELRKLLDAVYSRLVERVEFHGGSVIGFAGDSITCWFDAGSLGPEGSRDAALRSLLCAEEVQGVLRELSEGDAGTRLDIKVAIASGRASRLVGGDPGTQLLDEIAGATISRMAAGELLATSGETVADEATIDILGEEIQVAEWRDIPGGLGRFGLVGSLSSAGSTRSETVEAFELSPGALRPWILPPVWRRELAGQGAFLAEFRPCVTLFLGFGGIDYDEPSAGPRFDAFARRVQESAAREGGDLLQITIGDKGSFALLVFGATTAHENDARRAVTAALDLRAAMRDFPWLEEPRCGVSKGTLLVGAYGGPSRRAFSVLGDDVNIAARLMQAAGPGEILIAGRVHFAIQADFDCGPEMLMAVKGKNERIPAYLVKADKRGRTLGLLEPRYSLPVAGRKPELAMMAAILDATLAGEGGLLRITGEAGLGKSRLLAELASMARARGFECYGGACHAGGGKSAWLPWKAVFASLMEVDPEAAPVERLMALSSFVSGSLPSRSDHLPLLGPLFDLAIEDSDATRGLGAEGKRNELHALLRELLAAQAGKKPLILIIEDLHWIDELSLALMGGAARMAGSARILVVTASRPLPAEAFAFARFEELRGQAWFREIRLSELDADTAAELAKAKWKSLFGEEAPPSPGILGLLMERSQGNPFYIEELLNWLRDSGIDPGDAAAIAALDIPESLQSLVFSRIDHLTDGEKVTLKVASVIGRQFRASWLPGYYPEVGDFQLVRERLEQLESLDLTPLDSPEPELAYLFKHIVTHEVAYESLPYETRARLHERLAAYLELAQGDSSPLDAIAYHYARSDNLGKKLKYLRLAGDAARGKYANEAALEYYDQLLGLLGAGRDRVDVLLSRGDLLDTIGRSSGAEEAYRSALAMAGELGYQVGVGKAAQGVGATLGLRGEREAAFGFLGMAEKAFAAAGDESDRSRTLNDIGLFHARGGDLDAAAVWLDAGLAASRIAGDRRSEAAALNYLGSVANARGDSATARMRLGESLAIKREMGERFLIANSLNNLGVVAMEQGEFAEARDYLEEALSLRRAMGNKSGIAGSLANLGLISWHLGDLVKARGLSVEALALLRAIQEEGSEAIVLGTLGGLSLAEGDLAGATSFLRDGLELEKRVAEPQSTVTILVALALVAARSGKSLDALRLLEVADRLRASGGFVFDALVGGQAADARALAAPLLSGEEIRQAGIDVASMDLGRAIELGLFVSGGDPGDDSPSFSPIDGRGHAEPTR